MSDATTADVADEYDDSPLKRSITGRLLFFYVLGDVLGSGIYVLIGAVAGEVGGAFWAAFAVGVTVAAFTGLAYAELATKFPQAAGASLYVNKAFKNKGLTFMVTVLYLSATFAAAGSLAAGFAKYFGELWELPPTLLVMIVFIVLLALINYIGITESVVVNMLMTIVEVTGLVIVLIAGAMYVGQGKADFEHAHRLQQRRQHHLRDHRRCCAGLLRDDRLRERRERRRGDHQPAEGVSRAR